MGVSAMFHSKNLIFIINHPAFCGESNKAVGDYKLYEQCLNNHLKDCFANFTKLQTFIRHFDKISGFQSKLVILAPVLAVCGPIYLLFRCYQIRLIITGDDSPDAPGLLVY